MTAGRRDLGAARICLTAWLASVGFLALGGWALTRLGPHIPNGSRLWADAYDFGQALWSAAAGYAILLAAFWLLVFGLGAARSRSGGRTGAIASLLFALAMVTALLFCFLHASPGLFDGPIDSCMRQYSRAHPADPCLDCGIHSCEGMILRRVALTGALIVGALMAVSLWLRRRALD